MMDVDWINNWARENKYRVIPRGYNPQVVIVGETHNIDSFIEQQERLIDKLRPEYLLHEIIGIQTYDPRTRKKDVLKGRFLHHFMDADNKIPEYMIQWADKYGLFLVGCDLTLGEVEKAGQDLAKKHPDIYVLDPEFDAVDRVDGWPFTNQDEEVIPYRDRKMGEMIVEYAGKTTRPLVTIIGACHMRPESQIHQMLGDSNIGYICVDQSSS